MWVLMTLNLFDARRLVTGAEYLCVFEAAIAGVGEAKPRRAFRPVLCWLAVWSIGIHSLRLPVGQVPLYPSSAGGVISSASCAACTFVFFIFPNFDKIVNLWWFDTPMGIFDITLSFWLLFKGLRPSGIVVSRAQAGA